MIRRYLILFVFGLSALSGCSFIMPTRHGSELAQAQALIQSGKNHEAAAIYKQLADVTSDEQNYYRLLTADASIRANDVKQAKQYLNMIELNELDRDQLNHLNLLQAQVDLSQGNAEVALGKLKNLQIESLNNQTKIAYYQSLAFAYSLTGDTIQSAQTLINSESLINMPTQRGKHYEQILSALSGLSAEELKLKQQQSTPPLNGWIALAQVFKQDESSLSENIAKWRSLYPAHPANSAFLNDYVKIYQRKLAESPLIAVILPESGAYAAPAAVIKTGFMKAYQLAKKNGSTNSEIRFYDSEKDNAAKLYQQAIKDGAKLVVGPLDKKDIKALVTTELTIPVLALNHVEGLSFPKLYQFALSPIDDAGQITQKARNDGHQNALFLVPKSEQGKRFAIYLTDNWQKLGGYTVNTQIYDDGKTDFSQTTQNVSKQAVDENTVDALIINAYAKPARSLYPQLHKNKTTAQLPVYATSQIYLGNNDSARDKNLDGVTFCDVPWVFSEAYEGNLSKTELRGSWEDLSPSYLRLLPMGIDAYNLINHLSHLKTQPYNGATGKLKVDDENRITRELQCARFVNGVPKITDAAGETSDAATVVIQPDSAAKTTKKTKTALPDLPKLDDSL